MNYKIKIEDFLQLDQHCNIYAFDQDSRFIMCNNSQLEHIKKIIHITQLSDVLGKRMDEIFSPDAAKIVIDENNLVMRTGKTHQFINYVYHKSFQAMIFATVKTPLYNKEDELVGVFGISHYISIYQPPDLIFESLSKREQDCLKQLIKGKTATEISDALSLSKRTVETHIENIKHKLGCNSKSDIIDKIFNHGFNLMSGDVQAKSLPFNPGVFFSELDRHKSKK